MVILLLECYCQQSRREKCDGSGAGNESSAVPAENKPRRPDSSLLICTWIQHLCDLVALKRDAKAFQSLQKKATAVDRLEDVIAVLDNSNSTVLSFKALAENMMSEHKKEGTRMKARYLAQAYRIAIEEVQLKTWNDYCR